MIEKSSTRTPSSGAVAASGFCMRSLLPGQSKRALRDQIALNFVGSDADHPHQRVTQVLLEPAVVDRTGRLFGKRGAHPENVERRLAKTFHQLAGKDLADRVIFRRRRSIGRAIRDM